MKKVPIIMIVILLAISCVSYYLYNHVLYKEQRNIQNEKPEFSLSASSLNHEFEIDALQAYSKYSNKTIQIEGKVTEVSDSALVLDTKIFCKMNQKMNLKFINKLVTVKGRCIGYDDLFEVVKFDQCSNQ